MARRLPSRDPLDGLRRAKSAAQITAVMRGLPRRVPLAWLQTLSADLVPRMHRSVKGAELLVVTMQQLARRTSRHESSMAHALSERAAGTLAHFCGRSRIAADHLRAAAARFRRLGASDEESDALRVLVNVLGLLGRDAEALRAAARADLLIETQPGIDAAIRSRRRADLQVNVGLLHHQRERLEPARQAFAAASDIYRELGETRRLATATFNLGNVWALGDRVVEARQCYEAARLGFERADLPVLTVQCDFALGELDALEAQLDDAQQRLRRAHDAWLAAGDRVGAAHAQLDLADVLLRLNRPLEADAAAKRARNFFRAAQHRSEIAQLGLLRSAAALQFGRPKLAVRLAREASAAMRALGHRAGAAWADVHRARALIGAGRPRDAARLAAAAARILAQQGMRSRASRGWTVAASALLALKELNRALKAARQAVQAARAVRDRRAELAARLILAELAEAQSNRSGAYRELCAAERLVEQLRSGVTTDESRLAFALDKSVVYERLVANRLALGTRAALRAALTFAERGKARSLLERLNESVVQSLIGGGPQARRLMDRLARLERDLAVAEARLEGGGTPGLRALRSQRVSELARQRLALWEAALPRSLPLLGPRIPDPWAAVESLAAEEIVLEYFVAGDDVHLFVIERGTIEALPSLTHLARLQGLWDRLRFQLGKGVLGDAHHQSHAPFISRITRQLLGELDRELLGSLRERCVGREVRIIPHGPLHGLPFHALEREGRPLIADAVVSYAPSLTLLSLLGTTTSAKHLDNPPLILGVSDGHAPAIDAEVRLVRRHLGTAAVLSGAEATRAVLADPAARSGLLHVACHGFFAERHPAAAGLRLGDTWLTLADVYALPGVAEMIVLSGCETGRGTVYSGDEWVGLVRGFLQAGARTVVAALWELHDASAVTLMDHFYRALTQGHGAAAAMAIAQRAVLAEDPSPLRWAPFAVVGDSRYRLTRLQVA